MDDYRDAGRAGGGTRVPTAVTAFKPGRPTVRRVKTVRVRPGETTVTHRCSTRERLVRASHAFAFATRTPPTASLVESLSADQAIRGREVVVTVRADAEIGDVRAVVQVHAVCTRAQ
jgi:hypothetical protein